MLVELVQYTDPPGRPWPPGYRISDQGLLNIAFGFRERAEFEAAHARCVEAGLRAKRPARFASGPGRSSTSTTTRASASSCSTSSPGTRGRMGFRPRADAPARAARGAHPGAAASRAALREGAGHRRRRGARAPSCAGCSPRTATALVAARPRRGRAGEAAPAELGDGVEVATREAGLRRPRGRGRAPPRELVAEHPDIDLLIACAGLDRAQSLLALRLAPGARRLHRQLARPTWCCCRTWRRRWRGAAAAT